MTNRFDITPYFKLKAHCPKCNLEMKTINQTCLCPKCRTVYQLRLVKAPEALSKSQIDDWLTPRKSL